MPSSLNVLSIRASAIDFDVTVRVRTRARENRKSSVPRREMMPREARPKILGKSPYQEGLKGEGNREGAARSAAEKIGKSPYSKRGEAKDKEDTREREIERLEARRYRTRRRFTGNNQSHSNSS